MTWTAIPNGDIDPDSPTTTGLMTALRDNVAAMGAGDSGAPEILGATGASLILLATGTASASSSLDFTGIDGAYPHYVFMFEQVLPATNNAILQMRVSTDGGATYISTSVYQWVQLGNTTGGTTMDAVSLSDTQIYLVGSAGKGLTNNALGGISGKLTLSDAASATAQKNVFGEFVASDDLFQIAVVSVAGSLSTAASDVDAVRFMTDTGNITSGVIRMYGVKDA